MAPARFLSLLPLLSPVLAQYTQQAKWDSSNFFSGFTFFTASDPTDGFVNYVDQSTAQSNGLISTAGGKVYMGVDYTTTLNSDGSQGGRQSVRLTSNADYTTGLFILDASHMPGGICGVWPSWWTFGPNWPNNGEIDIIEQVNTASTNLMSLHTGNGCTAPGSGETGTVVTGDCYQYDPNQESTGCGVADEDNNSFGNGFNSIGGGVYAMEWTDSAIQVWYFPRGSVPSDITSGSPNPTTWGTPQANFGGSGCDVSSHFSQHNIIFDTTFCGSWAGEVFESDSTCAALSSSCQDYVAGSPGAFKNAYWEINYLAVYTVPSAGPAGTAEDIEKPAPTSTQVPVASTSSIGNSVANNGQGASTVAPPPGVTPVPKVAPAKLNQVPANQNSTNAEGFALNKRGAVLVA